MIIASELFDLECGHGDSCVSMYVACVAQLKISGVVLNVDVICPCVLRPRNVVARLDQGEGPPTRKCNS